METLKQLKAEHDRRLFTELVIYFGGSAAVFHIIAIFSWLFGDSEMVYMAGGVGSAILGAGALVFAFGALMIGLPEFLARRREAAKSGS